MTYEQALEYIHSLLAFGSQPGLERITELLSALGNPQDSLRFIHVAGTNGKGSTCTMLSEIFRQEGLKTGLYTSPYIVDFRERMQINGEYIEKEELAELCETVKDTGIYVTEFEFITALAMLWFKKKKCDLVVLEVGLGGRFDATNVIDSPLCSVIMKIDYDHTAILGNTLDEIAAEKCGIIKKGCPVVSYPLQEAEAFNRIKDSAPDIVVPELRELVIHSSSIRGNSFTYKSENYTTRLIGVHQVYNAITAVEAVHASGLCVSPESIKKGIASATIPARLELISEAPIVFLDGAHNPNGADAISGFMKGFCGNIVAVCGMMADKNCEGFLQKVLPFCRSVITVTVKENPRTIKAEDLAVLAKKYCDDVDVAADYEEAIRLASEKTKGDPLFVFGSLYLAGAIREGLISTYSS